MPTFQIGNLRGVTADAMLGLKTGVLPLSHSTEPEFRHLQAHHCLPASDLLSANCPRLFSGGQTCFSSFAWLPGASQSGSAGK